MRILHHLLVAVAAFTVIWLAGCAGGEQSLSLPSVPSVGALPQPIPDEGPQGPVVINGAIGSATALYSQVASGAMSCWFAPGGPLKKDYIYHASADAPSRGGKAEIVIHQRDPSQPNPRGPRVFLVHIAPTGDSTAAVTTENLKMSTAFTRAMIDDVRRWSKGEEGCVGPSTAAGWAPAPPPEPPPAEKPKANKTKHKAAQVKPAAAPQ